MSRLAGSIASSSVASRSTTSLVTPAVLAMSDSAVPSVDAHLFDYLNIEMLGILQDSATTAQERMNKRRELIEQDLEAEYPNARIKRNNTTPSPFTGSSSPQMSSALQPGIDEAIKTRLEAIGFRIGWCLAERLAKERPPILRQAVQQSATSAPMNQIQLPLEPLEIVKFICKDIWVTLYDKQIDNLRTNHRGVFVLLDNAFKPLLRLSVSDPSDPASRDAGLVKGRQVLASPCGIIRGALAVLGVASSCTVDWSGGGQCTFQIKTIAKAT